MKFTYLLACSAVGLASAFSTAGSQKHLPLRAGRELRPVAYARGDGHGHPIGPWKPIVSGDFTPNHIVFDLYEADPNGTGDTDQFRGAWGQSEEPDPWAPDTRLFGGPTYKLVNFINDFTVASGYNGGTVKSMRHAFFFNPPAAETLSIEVSLFDNFNDTLPPATGPVANSDWIFTFTGPVSPGTGYYTAAFTLTGTDVWNLPSDGSGAYQVQYFKTVTGTPVRSTMAQPMLWVIKPGHNAGNQGDAEWDDDNPRDGAFTANEEYSYNFGIFPAENTTSEPYGGMLGMYADYAPSTPAGSVTTTMGTRFSGNLASLNAVDNNKYCAFNDDTTLETNIQIGSVTTNLDPASVGIAGTTNVSRTGLTQELLAHNYTTGQNDLVDSREASLTNDSFTVDLVAGAANGSVAGDYVDGSGNLQADVHTYPFNDETPSQDGWLTCVDEFHWSIQ